MSVLNKMMSLLGLAEEDSQEHSDQHHASQAAEPEIGQDPPVSLAARKGATVVSLHTQKQVRVVLCEAKEFDDAQIIADHLRSRRPVVMNLHKAPFEVAMRILDFISGTTYALGGRMEKLGQQVFLCAPENIEIQGEISELLEAAQAENARQVGK